MILNRPCKSFGCSMMPAMGMGGYCHVHQRQDPGFERKQKEKERKAALKKITSKSLHTQQSEVAIPQGTQELQRWFNDRHKEMKGSCQHCGGKSEKGRSTYKCSIAHIFPKATFKSVATHPDNWIELCFYGKSCHTNLDNYALDISELNCFDEVIRKVVSIYPHIAIAERRRIPQVLLNYIEVEK